MTKITTFDRNTAASLQNAIVDALKGVEAQFGIIIRPAGGTLNGAKFTAKFECAVIDPAAVEADARKKFELTCALFDLKPEHYGTVLTLNGRPMKLVELNPGRPKYPAVFAEVGTGKRFKYTDTALARVRAAA